MSANNLQTRIVRPFSIVSEKLRLAQQTAAAAQEPALVGVVGSQYPSIQDAIADGRYNIAITQDLVVTEDVVFGTDSVNAHLKITINQGVTLTMQDATFTDKEPFNHRSMLEITGSASVAPAPSGSSPLSATLTMNYSVAPSSRPFQVHYLKLMMLTVRLNSDAVSDLTYVDSRIYFDSCIFRIMCLGSTEPVLSGSQFAMVTNCAFRSDAANPSVFMWTSVDNTTFINCTFSAHSIARSSFLAGSTLSVVAIISCKFSFMDVGCPAQSSATWLACTFTTVALTSVPGGTTLDSNSCRFSQCSFRSWDVSRDPIVNGENNSFDTCAFTLLPTHDFTLGGIHNAMSGCNLLLLGGILSISGDGCSVAFCSYGSLSPLFTATVQVGAVNSKLIGNTFSGALTDLGTNTQDIGNTTT